MHTSSPNHPQTNGLVERFNQTLQQALKRLNQPGSLDWDVHLHKILFGYRASVHSSTKYSPFKLLYKREAVLPCEQPYGPDHHVDVDDVQADKLLLQYTEAFNEVYDVYTKAATNIENAQERQRKEWHRRHHATHSRKAVTFETQDDPSHVPSESRSAKKRGRPRKNQHKGSQAKAENLAKGDMIFIKNFYKKNKLDSDVNGPYMFVKITTPSRTCAVLRGRSGQEGAESVHNIAVPQEDISPTSE